MKTRVDMLVFLILSVLVAFTNCLDLSDDYKLEFLSTVFRHGDRSPVMVFPTSEYQESFWPQGFGQLTQIGKREEYHLGELYRKLYVDSGFLNKTYLVNQMYFRSTDYDRTLMSGESMLAALYPPSDEEKFREDLPWQPIPLHTLPVKSDVLLQGDAVDCPEFQRLLGLDQYTKEYMKLQEDNQELFRQLKEWTTVEYNVSTIWSISDELFIEQTHNLTMPSWYTDDLLFDQILPLQYYSLYLLYNTDYKKKLMGGIWANDVLTNMKKKSEGAEDIKDLQAMFYSAHDSSVDSMLSVFSMFNGVQSPYSSAFSVELYSNSKDNEFYVRFRYRNDTFSDVFHDLKHPNCSGSLCKLDELIKLMQPYLLTRDERDEYCKSTASSSNSSHFTLVLILSVIIGVCGLLLLVTLVVMVIILISAIRQKRKIAMYRELSTTEET